MLQSFPAPVTAPTLQPTQQALSLKVLAGMGEVRRLGRRNGGVGTQMSTRWGTVELESGPPDLGQRGEWAERRHRRTGKEGGVRKGITGAVLRHRMLPFLISVRFWRRWKEREVKKGAEDWSVGDVSEGRFESRKNHIPDSGISLSNQVPVGLRGGGGNVTQWNMGLAGSGRLTFSVMYFLCPSANCRA